MSERLLSAVERGLTEFAVRYLPRLFVAYAAVRMLDYILTHSAAIILATVVTWRWLDILDAEAPK